MANPFVQAVISAFKREHKKGAQGAAAEGAAAKTETKEKPPTDRASGKKRPE